MTTCSINQKKTHRGCPHWPAGRGSGTLLSVAGNLAASDDNRPMGSMNGRPRLGSSGSPLTATESSGRGSTLSSVMRTEVFTAGSASEITARKVNK